MSKFVSVAAAIVVVCAVPSLSNAQSSYPPTRDGITGAIGAGLGTGQFNCSGCETPHHNGFTGFVRLGYTLNSNFIVAAHLSGWADSDRGSTANFGFLMATTQWYPYTPAGWYIEGGLGWGRVRLEDDDTGQDLSSNSLSFLIGTGYDFRVGNNFSLTPFLNLLSASGDEAKLNSTSTNTSVGGNLLQIGLAFTWH